jgi:hypothetical protein
MVYTVDFEGDANLRVRDITILRNATFSNLNTSSNLTVGTDDLFVDTTTGNVGIGTTNPGCALNINLDSETGSSNTTALIIQNQSSNYAQIANGFGSRIQFKTNRGTGPTSIWPSAEIKGYIYNGAGGTGDYHALDLDVYGDNVSLNRGISILSKSYLGGPADTIMHGNVGIRTTNPTSNLHVVGNAYVSSNLTVTGFVGVGTTNPAYPLDVEGETRATSFRLNSLANTTITDAYVGANPYTYFTNSNDNDNSYMQFLHDFTDVVQAGSGPNSEIMSLQVRGKSDGTTDADTEVYIPGYLGVGTANPTAQLTLGASSGSQIAVTDNTRLLSNTHYLNYGSSEATDVEQVLLQFDTGGTNGNDQSEYAGYIDVEMVAQRTGTPNYGPEIFAARLNYILGWNEYDDVWKITIVQENKSVSPDTVNTFTVFKSVPVFKYKYVDRQLQIYVSFNANYFRGYTSFTARVTSDAPADVSMPGPDALMASGTVGTAEIGMCYGYGAKAAYVGIGTTNPTSNLHVVGTAAISSNLAVNTDDLFVDTNTGNVGIGTANPNALLHIEQTLDPILRIQGTASDSNAYIELRETTSELYGASLYYEGTSTVQGLRFGHFNGSSTLRTDMAIDRSTGRVGIGITNPLGKLAVLSPLSNIEATDLNSLRSNAAINIRAYGDSNDYLSIGLLGSSANDGNNPSAYIQNRWDIGGLAADLLLQPGGGNVGIGTTNPSYTLDVNGNMRCNSFTLSQKPNDQGEFIVERKDNGYTQGTLPLAHTTTFQWNVSIPDANYTTVTSKVSFTINDDNTGSRWMLKFLHYDADTNLKVRVNAGTQHTVDYNDTPEDAREDNDLSWTTIDITDDVNYAGVENTIYFWHNSTDAGSIVAVYVFPMSGPALPNEPVETDLHLYNGLYVSSNLAVNTDDLFVDTNTGNVGIGTTDPKSTLDVRGPIVAPVVAYASNRDSAYLIAASTDYTGESTNWGTLGFHHKIKSNSSGSPRVTIDTPYGGESFSVLGTGGVGIGTDNPSVPLHVFSSNFVSDAVGPAASANNVFRVSSTEVDSTLLVGASETGSYISSLSKASFANEKNLILNANGGNVGIGTTNPSAVLHIVDFNVNSTTELLRLEKSDTNGDINDASIGYIGMYLQDANTGGGEVARISYGHAGDDIQGSGTGQIPEGKGKLGFWTSDTGFADGVPVERMTINHKGNVGIGTGSPRATLDINSTNSIIIPSGTEAQKSGTPVTGMIRFSTSKNGIEYYDGTQWKLLTTGSNSGSGGDDVFTLNGYRIHVYTSGGTFTANGNIDNLDVLMVGGGGGGGADNGGAGGAGGLIFKPKSYILSGDYTIQIGTGGTGAPAQGTTAGTGGDTTAFSLTAVGGGYGNNGNNGDGTANSGGSGGGGDGERITSGGSGTQPTQSGDSGTYGHGNDGGDTAVTIGGGGGGGGAGEAGSNGSTTIGGVGGDGLNEVTVSGVVYNFATIFGTDYGEIINGEAWFAGGGAGGNNNGSATSVAGGKGGGGSTANYYPDDGTTNTGGGGGGSTYTGSTVPAGANGGSGIVIIRYPL